MIDGKPYKMLRWHVTQNGYTPESYRKTFRLARDYPMIAAEYSEERSAVAHKIGTTELLTPHLPDGGERWWARRDSNPQPSRYERPALTVELQAHREGR
jgi:hypothetical protein